MSFSTALDREWRVFRYGMGFSIPIWSVICYIRSWCRLTGRSARRFARYDELEGPQEMLWDDQTELIYSKWERKGKWIVAVVCVYLLLTAITSWDSIKPRYRGDDLTMDQFSANYNSLLAILDKDGSYDRMQSDGTWYPQEGVTVYVGGTPLIEQDNFTYETENGFVRKVRYENRWTNAFYCPNPMEGKCAVAVMSTMLAQDWISIGSVTEFTELWNASRNDLEGHITYENLEIIWYAEVENCANNAGVYIPLDLNKDSKLDFYFEMIVHDR